MIILRDSKDALATSISIKEHQTEEGAAFPPLSKTGRVREGAQSLPSPVRKHSFDLTDRLELGLI